MGMALTIVVVAIYLIVTLVIGWLATRRTSSTVGDDYFMASRTLSKITLVMAVLATQWSAFVIMGLPGEAYRSGFGTLGKYASVAFGCAFGAYMIGYRAWLLGKRYGYSTSPELLAARFSSPAAHIVTLVVSLYYTVPYLITGMMAGGQAVVIITQGAVPYWLGALIMGAVTVYYIAGGGMRGAAQVAVLQGVVIFIGMVILVIFVGASQGTANILEKVPPNLLTREGKFTPVEYIAQALIMFGNPVIFPQLLAKLMSSRSVEDLKITSVAWPVGTFTVFALAILMGVWGAALVPGLQGPATENVLFMMFAKYAPPFLGALLIVVLLAAVASTLDGQLLTVSQLATLDIFKRYTHLSEDRVVRFGRWAVIVVAMISYLGALIRPGNILVIAVFAFAGFCLLFWGALLALHWKRMNKWGFVVGVSVGEILLHLWQFHLIPYFPGIPNAFLPALIITVLLSVVISLTIPQSEDEARARDRFFSVFAEAFGDGGKAAEIPVSGTVKSSM
ncbi:MAG: sodium:solute symporter family protein [Clostridia bacterium]|nr:MAG: sodium:solute symporter family protein [Clostridia bacterium]